MCVDTCANLWELVFSFYYVSSMDWTQVPRSGSKHIYLGSHLNGNNFLTSLFLSLHLIDSLDSPFEKLPPFTKLSKTGILTKIERLNNGKSNEKTDLFKIIKSSWAWQCIHLIPALGREAVGSERVQGQPALHNKF